jgi:hypothetical protein
MVFRVPQILLFRKPYNWRDYYFILLTLDFVVYAILISTILAVGFGIEENVIFLLFFFFSTMIFMFGYVLWAIILLWHLLIRNKDMLLPKKVIYIVGGFILFPIVYVSYPLTTRYYLKHMRKRWDPEKAKNKKITVFFIACMGLILAVLLLAVFIYATRKII